MAKAKKGPPVEASSVGIKTDLNAMQAKNSSDEEAKAQSSPEGDTKRNARARPQSRQIEKAAAEKKSCVHAAQTPSITNDDKSSWSKSKRKRMRKKRRKEAKQASELIKSAKGNEFQANKVQGDNQIGINDTNEKSKGESNKRKSNSIENNDIDVNTRKRQRQDSTVPEADISLQNNREKTEESPPRKKKKAKKPKSASKKGASAIPATETVKTTAPPTNSEKVQVKNDTPEGISSQPKQFNSQANGKEALITNGETNFGSDKINYDKGIVQSVSTDSKRKQAIKASRAKTARTPLQSEPTPKIGRDTSSKGLKSGRSISTLQKSFLDRLAGSRFRELNEELYTSPSKQSFEKFKSNPELFDQYHIGFRKQVKNWPINPIDMIYKKILSSRNKNSGGNEKDQLNDRKKIRKIVVADFGCGDAKLAERLLAVRAPCHEEDSSSTNKSKKKKPNMKSTIKQFCPFEVHSFDLVSGGNPLVTPSDMSDVPLPEESVDVGVYCLALMGTNVADFVREGWRVLKSGGVLRVAEVRSRFETVSNSTGLKNDRDESKNKSGGGKKRRLSDGARQNLLNSSDFSTKPLMLLDEFISLMERCGFRCTNLDRTNKMFLFMDFVKVDGSKGLSKKETFSAKPCIYKRR